MKPIELTNNQKALKWGGGITAAITVTMTIGYFMLRPRELDGSDYFTFGGLVVISTFLLVRGFRKKVLFRSNDQGIWTPANGWQPWSNVQQVATGVRSGYKGIPEPFLKVIWKDGAPTFQLDFSNTNWKVKRFEKEALPEYGKRLQNPN